MYFSRGKAVPEPDSALKSLERCYCRTFGAPAPRGADEAAATRFSHLIRAIATGVGITPMPGSNPRRDRAAR